MSQAKVVRSEQTLYRGLNVQSGIVAENIMTNDTPTGGSVIGKGIDIQWQDGARAVGTEEMQDSNGAFVEDVIYAALQRLQFFNETQYRSRENSMAITHLEEALGALNLRRLARQVRGVEGKHEV